MDLFFRHDFGVFSDEFQASGLENAHICVIGMEDGQPTAHDYKYLITVTLIIG